MSNKINRINIDHYKKVFSKIEKDKFLTEKTKITGLVSFINQDIVQYYADFKIHRFLLSVWENNSSKKLNEQELIVYRAVRWDENDEYLLDILPLSIINLEVYLDVESKSAIFDAGTLLKENYSHEFDDYRKTHKNIVQLFGEIEHDYENYYKSEIVRDEKNTAFRFKISSNCSIIDLVTKAYQYSSPLAALLATLEKCALDELFELTQKGWFQKDNCTEKDFLIQFRKGHLLDLTFQETSFSIWYEDTGLFEHRIYFNGNYDNGIQETALSIRVGPESNYNKTYLLNKERETIETVDFGVLKLDQGELFYDGKVTWLDRKINISFATNRKKIIGEKPMQTAVDVFKNQSEWETKAFAYAVDNFLASKNEDWLNDDEAPLSAEEFKKLLSDFSLIFDEEQTFTFTFRTDEKLFSGHSVSITGTIEDGFVDCGF